MFNFTQLPPLSLYIHIPWCIKKCPYCDFNSHVTKTFIPENDYIEALILDLEQELPSVWGRQIISIFIGGGTPSLFSPQGIEKLISQIRARLSLLPACEITLEANPGTVEYTKFSEFRDAGINRLSIGIQSFQPDLLTRIGRIHDEKEAFSAAQTAHESGFNNINLDLMFGLPGQTLQQAQADLDIAIGLSPQHISYYQLTIEPETAFYKRPPELPIDEKLSYMQTSAWGKLSDANYSQYEVSAYARDGFKCQHNLNYWEFGDYLGIGAGAHGKITSAAKQTITRNNKTKQPQNYMTICQGKHITENIETLDRRGAALEFMMNALRLTHGFDPRLLVEHAGVQINIVDKQLNIAESKGLIERSIASIKPTKKGRLFLNDLLCLFLD